MGWFWRTAYRIYEQRLAGQVSAGEMPRHVGIILDGNRRHALAHGVQQPETVYRAGAAKLDDVIAWSIDLGILMMALSDEPANLRSARKKGRHARHQAMRVPHSAMAAERFCL
jgi:short-chain Z-isoprenyl diphosphate synthase